MSRIFLRRYWWGPMAILGVWWVLRATGIGAHPAVALISTIDESQRIATGDFYFNGNGTERFTRRASLLPAEENPFVPRGFEAPVVVDPVSTAPVYDAPAPTIEGVPELGLRFLGRLRTPAGQWVIYAQHDGVDLRLTQGVILPNGYQVSKIMNQTVVFTHLVNRQKRHLEIPASPTYEIR